MTNGGRKYRRMLPHSAILLTCIKRQMVSKTNFRSFWEWPFHTGFTVHVQVWFMRCTIISKCRFILTLCVDELLILCILETLKGMLWQTAKTQMKCSIVLYFIMACRAAFDHSMHCFKDRTTPCFRKFYLWHLNVHNGQSHNYCINMYGKIHQNTKELLLTSSI